MNASLPSSVRLKQGQSMRHMVTDDASDLSTDTDEENRRILELQDELMRLRTKKRNRDTARSSTSSSSGNSSAGKVTSRPKPKRRSANDPKDQAGVEIQDDQSVVQPRQKEKVQPVSKDEVTVAVDLQGKKTISGKEKKVSTRSAAWKQVRKKSSSEESGLSDSDDPSVGQTSGKKVGVSCPRSPAGAEPAGGQSVAKSVRELKDAWRREFKIKGQIGALGEKNKLDYVSVKRQVDAGLKKGYDNADIVEAIINCWYNPPFFP